MLKMCKENLMPLNLVYVWAECLIYTYSIAFVNEFLSFVASISQARRGEARFRLQG